LTQSYRKDEGREKKGEFIIRKIERKDDLLD
jgi:hypothetical protein